MNKRKNKSRKGRRSATKERKGPTGQKVNNLSTEQTVLTTPDPLLPQPSHNAKEANIEPGLKKSRWGLQGVKRFLQSVLAFLRSHWKGTATAAFTVVLGTTGWQVTTCITARRAHLQEFKNALDAYRPVGQTVIETEGTFHVAHRSFVDYLSQENVQLEELKKREDQLIALARTNNENCNSWRTATIKYFSARREVFRHFRRSSELPDIGTAGICIESLRVITSGWPEDLKSLAEDPVLRRHVVDRERRSLVRLRDIQLRMLSAEPLFYEREKKLIKELEAEDASLLGSARDCLGISSAK